MICVVNRTGRPRQIEASGDVLNLFSKLMTKKNGFERDLEDHQLDILVLLPKTLSIEAGTQGLSIIK